MKVRHLFAMVAAAALALPLAACNATSQADAKARTAIDVGYIGDFSGSSWAAVAQKQNLWQKHGLDAKLKVFNDGPTQIQALGAGDLDFGYIGPGAVWLPATNHAKIVSVAMLGTADRVIAQPGRGITSITDLKGKKVGVPEGTSGDMILQLAMKQAGLAPDAITRINMDPSTLVSAFSSGAVDAAAIWYPLVGTIKKHVPGLVELAKNEDFFPKVSFPNSIVASNDMADKNPATVKAFLQVYQEANDWIAANKDQAIAIDADFMKLTKEQVAADAQYVKTPTTAELVKMTQDGTINGWYKSLTDVFVTMGKLKESPEAKTYYAGDLFVAAGTK